MKVRSGFVSNSSTSSFVAVLAAEDYEQIVKTATANPIFQKLLITGKAKPKKQNIKGVDVVAVSIYEASEDGVYVFNDEEFEHYDEEGELTELAAVLEKIGDAVAKKNKLVVTFDG